MNVGYLGGELDGGTVRVRFYYDVTSLPEGDSQPLINGPLGYCLEVINTSGRNVRLDYTIAGVSSTATVGQGNPVTTGPTAGRSRTAAQLAASGFTTRGAIGSITIGYA